MKRQRTHRLVRAAIVLTIAVISIAPSTALCRSSGDVATGSTSTRSPGQPATRPAQLENATVRLQNDRTLTGTLRLIRPGLYLLQSDEELYEISQEEIAEVDGHAGLPRLSHDARRLIHTQTYEIVAANGDVEKWYKTRIDNESDRAYTFIQFGAKQSELDMYRRMEIFDDSGNQLHFRVERRKRSELYDVTVDLAVPSVPGETISLSQRLHEPGRARRDGDRFAFTFMGDFPEDRILLRKVKLPPGAEIESVEPEPAFEFEHDGSKVVVWRRYYPQGQHYPLTVVYRLPE